MQDLGKGQNDDGSEEEEKYADHKIVKKKNDKDEIVKPSELITRIFDRDQEVPQKVHNPNKDHRLNTVDPDWKYNMTLGDLELRKITHYDGKEETLWFPMEKYPDDYFKSDDDKQKKKKAKPPRKVFVSLKVKRVSAVDNIHETFRMRFHIYFNWLPTESDYKAYYQASKEAKEQNNPQILMEWEPKWYAILAIHTTLYINIVDRVYV